MSIELDLTSWVTDTLRMGEVVVLVTTSDQRAQTIMPRVAEALNMSGTASNPDPCLMVDDSGRLALEIPGFGRLTRPGDKLVHHVALTRGNVFLVVGYLPMSPGEDVDRYMHSVRSSRQCASGDILAQRNN